MEFSRVTQDFEDAVERADTIEALKEALEAITLEMGYRHFALTHHVDVPRVRLPAIRIHNYPDNWVEYFDAEGLGPSDPVHRASHMTNAGFRWSKLAEIIDLTGRDIAILDRSRKAGLGEGFTVPAHIPGEWAGSCSFATGPGKAIRREWAPLAQFIGATAFAGARRLSGIRRPDTGRPLLSDRQRDCIFWAARGKSAWEISVILGIAHETVIQHLKEARFRYGVEKSGQLAIHALYDGAFTFIDVLRK